MRQLTLVVSLLLLITAFSGCSSSSNTPIQPDSPVLPSAEMASSNTQVLYTGTLEINPETMTITQAVDRQSDIVYVVPASLLGSCPGGCFSFAIMGIVGTVLEIELTLENPIALLAYDLRLECIKLTGLEIVNPDSYTDFLGTPIFDVKPFIAFTKEDSGREFPIGPGGIDTETLYLDCPSGQASITYAITASLPDQTGEPYEISEMSSTGILTPTGGLATVSCRVDDHQDDVSGVYLNATPFMGEAAQMVEGTEPGLYEYGLENPMEAPVGIYNQLIMALSPNPQDISTYNYVQIEISDFAGDVVYVDDSYVGPPYDGTMERPFIRIQNALAVAPPGWEVWVDDSGGDYHGPVTLKDNVVLRSVNWDDSDGGDMASIHSAGAAPVVIGADNAVIDGFKIYGSTSYGISISGVDTAITNCWITEIASNIDHYGIFIENSSGSVIENCEISEIRDTDSYGKLYGIYLNNSPIRITGNVMHEVKAYDGFQTVYGIYALNCLPDGDDHLIIRNNLLYNIYTYGFHNGGQTTLYGMYINTCNDVEIVNNLVHSLLSGEYKSTHGITLSTLEGVEFTNNVIYDVRKTNNYGNAYGLQISACVDFDGRNNIVAHIRADGYYQGAYGVSGPEGTVWEYGDVYDISSSRYSGGIVEGTGCIESDAMFVDIEGDFHLQSGSPCIDTGDPAILDYDSSRSDMGCYGGPGGDW
jgi:hypothetical protein